MPLIEQTTKSAKLDRLGLGDTHKVSEYTTTFWVFNGSLDVRYTLFKALAELNGSDKVVQQLCGRIARSSYVLKVEADKRGSEHIIRVYTNTQTINRDAYNHLLGWISAQIHQLLIELEAV